MSDLYDYPTYKEAFEKFKSLEVGTGTSKKPLEESLTTGKDKPINSEPDKVAHGQLLFLLYISRSIEQKLVELKTLTQSIKDKPESSKQGEQAGALVPSGTNTYGQYKAPSKRTIKRKRDAL
jgi:hypothetical protein